MLGREGARAFLLETLWLAGAALRRGGSAAQGADETCRLLAARVPRQDAGLARPG